MLADVACETPLHFQEQAVWRRTVAGFPEQSSSTFWTISLGGRLNVGLRTWSFGSHRCPSKQAKAKRLHGLVRVGVGTI